jgi:preprotein translocase subunit YajC
MYLQNRWVPSNLMDTLLISSLLMAIIILGLLYFLSRSEKKKTTKGKTKVIEKRKHTGSRKQM